MKYWLDDMCEIRLDEHYFKINLSQILLVQKDGKK